MPVAAFLCPMVGTGTPRVDPWRSKWQDGGPDITITAISKANPGVVTAPAHGLTDGCVVAPTVVGMTELNGKNYRVVSATADTFQLSRRGVVIDTTLFGDFVSGKVNEHGLTTGQLRFGHFDDTILVINASQPYLDAIAADADCRLIATAATIDDPLTAPQVSAIQTFLENRGVPADWLQVGETRRQAIRGLCGMFMFSQRMEGLLGESWKRRLVAHGVTLATEWQALPAALQNELVNVAVSHGWTNVVPQPTHTLRQILKAMGNRFQNTPINIGTFVV